MTPEQLEQLKKLFVDSTASSEEYKIKFACELCDNVASSSLSFALHSIKHSDKYHCHYCSYKTSKEKNIKRHMKSHGSTRNFHHCEVCYAVFTESIQAQEHKHYHTGEMPFNCNVCERHFMFSWLRNTHQRLIHLGDIKKDENGTHTCTICNLTIGTRSGLRKHQMRKHQPRVQPLCDICGKSLSSNETLKFHKRTHTGYKPHVCSTCGKSFCKKGLLVEHERVHTGEKPFICMYCEKGFSQRGPLKIHIRIHTGERPFVCRLCGKGCICKSVLDAHMKSCSGAGF